MTEESVGDICLGYDTCLKSCKSFTNYASFVISPPSPLQETEYFTHLCDFQGLCKKEISKLRNLVKINLLKKEATAEVILRSYEADTTCQKEETIVALSYFCNPRCMALKAATVLYLHKLFTEMAGSDEFHSDILRFHAENNKEALPGFNLLNKKSTILTTTR